MKPPYKQFTNSSLRSLEVMGIQVWKERSVAGQAKQTVRTREQPIKEKSASEQPAQEASPQERSEQDALSQEKLPQDKPEQEALPQENPMNQIPPKEAASTNSKDESQTTWQLLQDAVSNCRLCDLCKSRTNTVFGVGDQKADLLVIGEAPGANEDRQGEPFVGRAGKLLDAMLVSIGLDRKKIYISNILKCRPPNNRDPLPHEVATCTPYLTQQIELLQPKLIMAVGRIAAHFLLDTNATLGKLRGQTYHYGESQIPLIVTYHPAYLLRSPSMKQKAYEDFLKIQAALEKI